MIGSGRPATRPARRITFVLAALLLLAAAVSATLARTYRSLLSTSGLNTTVYAGAGFQGPPLAVDRDAPVRSNVVRARAALLGQPFSTESRGYLLIPSSGRYRIVVLVDDRATVEIERQRVTGSRGHPAIAVMELTRGLHPIVVRYEDDGGQQALEILWAKGNGIPATISRLALVPALRPYEEVRLRGALGRAMLALPVFWSGVLLAVAAFRLAVIVRRLSTPGPRSFLPLVLLAAAAVISCGIWWGLPDFYGWAPDELTPGDVNDALARRLAGGWAGIYPPLHYAVLIAFTAPFHLLSTFGLADLEHLHVHTAVFLVQRAVTVVMALGILGLVYAIGSQITPRAGALAAAIVSVALPFSYYAKLANVDVPYVFWFTLSMAYYVRMPRTGATADFLLFVLTGVAAIATKDQAYGFYVLPAIAIVFACIQRARGRSSSRGAPTPRVLLGMTALAIAALLLFENVLFNFRGVVDHLKIITGPGSADFRMYPRTAAGEIRMLRDAMWQLGGVMSWPLFAIAAVSGIVAWRSRATVIRRLLLPLLSYYVTFIAIVGYHYDRFFIGPAVILALAGGWGLDTWLTAGQHARGLKLAAVIGAFAYALSRVLALDALMLFDSRYAVEAWLLEHAPASAHLAAAGQYLPRGGRLFWAPLAQDPDALAALAPDFVIVNVGTNHRWPPGTEGRRFYEALSTGATYRRVLQQRTSLAWSPLRWEKRYADPDEDPFTNLDKVNPLIEVFERNTDATAPRRRP